MFQDDNFTLEKFQRNPRRVLQWAFAYMTSAWRALPDFLIIGTQKGGTSSLYANLQQHPQVAGAFRKEVKFFDCNYPHGMMWYRSHFEYRAALRSNQALTGEASPYYMYHPVAANRIKKELPGVKMIALLRNPVERAYSHYNHMFRSGRETLSFEEAINREEERLAGEVEKISADPYYSVYTHMHFSYLGRGRYVEQLKRSFSLFPREQILVLNSRDLFENPDDAFQQSLKFLGLPEWHPTEYKVKNQASYSGMPAGMRQRLVDYFKPYNEQLEDLLGMKFNWK